METIPSRVISTFSSIEPKPLKSLTRRKTVERVSDERCYGDGIFVYLKNGYCALGEQGLHQFSEETLKECVETMKGIEKCNCEDCKA